jgi:FkbM family methyltransferase
MPESSMDALKRVLRHPDPPQLWYQLQEIVESRTYLQHGVEVREGDVVLDVGANIGVAATFFAEECGAGAVHSFEPVQPIFEVLRENLREFPACIPHCYGLASKTGRRTITYYPNDWSLSGLYADPDAERSTVKRALMNLGASESDAERRLARRFETETLPCELRTLSDALEAESIERVDLLKVDVEKAELEVLDGIEEQHWPRIAQIAAEFHVDRDRREEAAEGLRARGFEVTVTQDPAMSGTAVYMLYAVRR